MITFLNILSLALSIIAFTMSLVLYFKVMRLEKMVNAPKETKDKQIEVDDEQKKKEDELLRL
jgi:hypothetical protein